MAVAPPASGLAPTDGALENTDSRVELTTTARSGSLSFAGAVLSAAGAFFLVVIVSRGLGASGAGVFAMVTAVWMTLTVTGRLGADSALVRILPRLRLTKNDDAIRRTITTALVPVIVVMAGVGLCVWLLAPSISLWLTDSDTHAALIRIVAVFLPLGAASFIALAATRGLGSITHFVAIENITKPILRCTLVAAALYLGAGVFGVTVGWAIATAVTGAAAILTLSQLLRRYPNNPARRTYPVQDVWGFALPRAGAQFCEIIAMHVGVVLMGILGSPDDAGIFNAAMRLVLAGALAVQALNIALGPQISRLLATDSHTRAQEIHHTTTSWIVLVTWPVYLTMVVWPQHTLSIFGSEFSDGASTLLILAVAVLISMGAGSIGTILLMSGRSTANLGIAVTSLALQIGGSLLLAPWLGIVAVVLVKAIAIVGEQLAMVLVVRSGEGISTFNIRSLMAMATAFACFGIPAIAMRLTGHNGLTIAMAATLFSLVCYVAIIVHLRSVFHCDVLIQAIRKRLK